MAESSNNDNNNNSNNNGNSNNKKIDYGLLLKSAEIPYDYTIHASRKLKEKFTGTGIVICIPLDAAMYPEGASKFREFRSKGRRGILPMWALQNWLFTLYITYLRFAASNTKRTSELPFSMFVETLRSEKGAFVENRIWIFQKSDTTADVNILKIYNEIKTSSSKQFTGKGDLNAMGTVPGRDKSQSSSFKVDSLYLKTNSAVCLKIHEGMCRGTPAAREPDSPVKVFHPSTQFDKSQQPNPAICSRQRTIGTYITSVDPNNDICTLVLDPELNGTEFYSVHPQDMDPKNFMKKMFPHISVNMKEIEYINSLKILIAKKQLSEQDIGADTYNSRVSHSRGQRNEHRRRDGDRDRDGDEAPRRSHIFSNGISDMKRMHERGRTDISDMERDEMAFVGESHTDAGDDDDDDANDRNKGESSTSRSNNNNRKQQRRSNPAPHGEYGTHKKMKSWDEVKRGRAAGGGAENSDAACFDNMANMARQRMFDNNAPDSDGDSDVDIRDGSDNSDADSDEQQDMEDIEAEALLQSMNNVFSNTMGDDLIDTNCGDITKLNIGGDYDQFDDFGALSMLKKRVINLNKVIDSLFKDDPDMLQENRRIVEQFNVDFYVAHCHSSQSNISDKKQAIMEYWTANHLSSLRPKFKIHDPTYDHMISQVAIEMIENFGHFESIAFHQVTLFALWVGCMDRFRIELNQHWNALLTGNGGVGKSIVAEKLKANLPPKAVDEVDSRSTCFTAVNVTMTSRLQLGDEFEIGPKDDISRAKSLLSRGYVNRVSLNLGTDDSGRNLDHFSYICVGCAIENTNFTRMDMISKAGFANAGSIDALLTRYLQIQVNQYNDPIKPLRETMVAEQVISPSDEAFACRQRNIWLQSVVSDYWDLVYAKMLPPPNMECFDILMSKYETSLRSHGIPDLNNRTPNLIKLWCQSLVVLSAVIDLFCLPNSLHADHDYEPRLMLDIMPICHQQHAVFAFTLFYHAFFPSEFNTVVDIMNTLITDASKAGQKIVEFKDPKQERSGEETKAAQKAIAAAAEAAAAVGNSRGKKNGKGKGREPDSMDNGAGVGTGVRAGAGPNKTQWDHVREVVGGAGASNAQPRSSQPAQQHQQQSQPPALDGVAVNHYFHKYQQQPFNMQLAAPPEASGFYYVCFNDTSVVKLSQMIYNDARAANDDPDNVNITVIPSVAAIASVLEFFSRVKVWSTRYVNRNNMIVPESTTNKERMLGVIVHGYNVYINYTLLKDDKKFKQLWKIALEESMNRNTLEQKLLVGVPHENFPFYLQSVPFKPVNRTTTFKNPHYINKMTQLINYGTTDNQNLKECHQQEYLSLDYDIDMSCIIQAASKNPSYLDRLDVAGTDVSACDMYLYLTSPSIRFADMWEKTAERGKAIRYPEDNVRINNEERMKSRIKIESDDIPPSRGDDRYQPPSRFDGPANNTASIVARVALAKHRHIGRSGVFAFEAPDGNAAQNDNQATPQRSVNDDDGDNISFPNSENYPQYQYDVQQ